MFIVYLANNQVIREDQCEWKLLPYFPIVCLDYLLPNKRTLRMQGFEQYFYLKEIYELFWGASGKFVDTLNLLGKHKNEVYQFSWQVRKGKAFQIKNKWGKEFRPLVIRPIRRKNKKDPKKYTIEFGKARKTNHNEWHMGVKQKEAKVELI